MQQLLTIHLLLLAALLRAGECIPHPNDPPKPTCADKTKSGEETDVDCGGPSCGPCPDTKHCQVARDCVSSVCSEGSCAAPSCSDAARNGHESDVDCGGGACPACGAARACLGDGDCLSGSCQNNACTSPLPVIVAPALDPTIPFDFANSTAFLYSGPTAVQTGVDAGTIESRRVVVLRGRALDRLGAPLPGVSVTALGRPEYGSTLTRANGMFDLVVNGGEAVTVDYHKPGFLPVQRQVTTPWRDFVQVPEVILTALSSQVTTVDLSTLTDIAVAQGAPVSDADGTRQETMLFVPGTTAVMSVGNSTQPLTTLHVRATEYTQGAGGPQAMPAALPVESGYTYAVDLSADEAIAAGATEVRFSQPVITYVENFLALPIGGVVPVGSYDRARGLWRAAPNGRIIKVLSISGGLAEVDTDGSGAANPAATAALGITTQELQRLAALYQPGQSLWRVPIDHFTPWDKNWPYGAPVGAQPPKLPKPKAGNDDVEEPCEQAGSIIGCQNQTLSQRLHIAGTPFALYHHSARIPGNGMYTVDIPLSSTTLPANLKRIDVEVTVAGQQYKASVSPAPSLTHSFVWNGKDGYDRVVQGTQPAHVRVGYTYDSLYKTPADGPASFALFPADRPASLARARSEVTLWQTSDLMIGGWLSTEGGSRAGGELGGWSLNVHHHYDSAGAVLFLGTGERRSARAAGRATIETVAGSSGPPGYSGDLGPATSAQLNHPTSVAVGADGSVFLSDKLNHRIRRVDPDGIITTVAGTGVAGYSGDDGPATLAQISNPHAVAVGPNGSLYFCDALLDSSTGGTIHRVRRVGSDGIVTRVAGNGLVGFSGDNGPATSAALGGGALGLALRQDGSIYLADSANRRIRRVSPYGTITTVAGSGLRGAPGALESALVAKFSCPDMVAVGPDGTVYVGDSCLDSIYTIGPSGLVTRLLQWPPTNFGYALGIAFAADGTYYTVDSYNNRIWRTGPAGPPTVLAGKGNGFLGTGGGFSGDHGSALLADLNPWGVAVGPDGSVIAADYSNNRIRKIRLPAADLTGAQRLVPSEDGREIHVFTADGRHLRTLDGVTSALRYEFAYDSSGLLNSVTDGNGQITTLERAPSGAPMAIVAPGGQRTELTLAANGLLATVANGSGTVSLAYTGRGFLSSLTDPVGGVHSFTYDARDRLINDADPVGGSIALTRTDTSSGRVVATTSALGRVTTYESQSFPTGESRWITTGPGGALTQTTIAPDGTHTVTTPDGTVTKMTLGPDPRWGMLVPINSTLTVATPGGLTSTLATTRVASLADPSDLLNLAAWSETSTINGRIYASSFEASTRKYTSTSPAGRTASRTVDATGNLIKIETAPSVTAATFSYDAQGRLTQVTQGPQSTRYGYDVKGRVISRTDAAGGLLQHAWDTGDRLISDTLPSGRTLAFAYDSNGNRTQVIMPSGAVHQLSYTANGLLSGYTSPEGTSYSFAYNLDGQLTRATLPSGRAAEITYDVGGRLAGRSEADAITTIVYSGATNRVSNITRTPTGGGVAQGVAFAYDGSLVKNVSFSGPASGSFAYRYDNNFFLVGMTLDAAPETLFTRDADGLVTGQGSFAWTRAGPNGATTRVTDGTLAVTYAHDALGRVASRTSSIGASQLYQERLTYDAVARVAQRVETVAGTTHTFDYTYDADGQLTAVIRDGTVVERYAYDVNGNRTGVTRGALAPETSTYDSLDRLQLRGGVTYVFDADGFLNQRGADTFAYSARGELLRFTSGSAAVSYGYDGLGRRTSRTTGAGTTQYLYGNPGNPFQVTHSRNSANVLTSFFYDEDGRLTAFDRGAARFYVGADAVGTPRVVSTSAGAVVKTLEYDAFGELLADSAPAFELPIGFAGGLWDQDSRLVHFGLRDYEPVAGRWTARDPLLFDSTEANLFLYAGNEPIGQKDPLGLISFSISGVLGGGAGASVAFTSAGMSMCVELGVGLGARAGVDLTGGLEPSGVALKASARVEAPMLTAELKAKLALSECGTAKGGLAATFGAAPLQTHADLLTGETGVGSEAEGDFAERGKLPAPKNSLPIGIGAEVKASVQACKQLRY